MIIYYSPIVNKEEHTEGTSIGLLDMGLEKLTPQGDMKVCPAHTSFVSKMFLVRSPVSFSLRFDGEKVYSKDLDQQTFDNLFANLRFNMSVKDEYLWVSMSFGYVFAAEDSCVAETYPAFMHGNPYEIAMGHLDIHKWQRPIDFTFKIHKDQEVVIQRGDPLYYVAFRTPSLTTGVKLQKVDYSELSSYVDNCLNVRKYMRDISWVLANKGGNSYTKKSKCPLGFIRKFIGRS